MRIDIGKWEIRSLTMGDVPSIARYADNLQVSANMRDTFPSPYTLSDAEAWVGFAMGQDPEVSFAIASPKEAIGGIGLRLQEDVHRRSAEVGYWLGELFWGRGIATAALKALSEYAFAEFSPVRLYGYVYESNPASCRVMEKAGFVFEGCLRRSIFKRGRIMDQFLYARVRD